MRVRLRQRERRTLEAWAREAAPREACGTLVGRMRDGTVDVLHVERGDNLVSADIDDAFDLDPMHLVRVDRDARDRGLSVVGVWHSHPKAPAELSERDRRDAARGWCHAIVSLADARIRVWRHDERGFVDPFGIL